MKNILAILIFLLIASASAASAQAVTKSKIIGKWRATAMEADGKTFSISSEASITQFFLSADKKKMSHEDSTLMKEMGKMIYGMVGDVRFEFKANDSLHATIGITMDGKKKTETETMHYSVADGKLTMDMAEDKKEIVEIQMPDAHTMALVNFSAAKGGKLIFSKQ
ncbi:MAG: hypothetical protein JWO03_2932 [Bacteroidetes bacterium]|nr:hypothetical protein [Bacteroidota bacterium]